MNNNLGNSQYRLRKMVGILGILLPIILLASEGRLLSSMSHYYYTPAGIFFLGILSVFGLLLISYKGYQPDPDRKERWSDDWITTAAGFCILTAVVIPTGCEDALAGDMMKTSDAYLFGHKVVWKNTVHLSGAGLFLLLLGFMCIKKFTASGNPESKRKHLLYRICGYSVVGSVFLLAALFVVEISTGLDMNNYVRGYVFKLETVAVWSFGIAWLVKGEIYRDVKTLFAGEIAKSSGSD